MTTSISTSQGALEQAMRLAIHYHAGQRDKAGECYMLHLLRVMLACSTPESMQVAVLHDVLEDTSATAEELLGAGIARDVVAAIQLLTKPDTMRYEEYIVRLSGNELAREAKIADIHDNYRLERVAYRPEYRREDSQRVERYILSHEFLTGRIPSEEYLQRMGSIE